jgi:poly-gamma-glutamate capsule biosynthesis protein CapA/YwtB (metallophosphatase superfamily)
VTTDERVISIAAVGDALPTKPNFPGGKPATSGLAETLETLRASDIVFANFEIPLSDRGYPVEKLINFHAPAALADDLPLFGFDIVNLANNHALDYGHAGLFDTMDAFDRAGIPRIGAGRNLEEAAAPAILEAGGLRVGFIAFTCLLPTGSAATPERAGFAPIAVRQGYEIHELWSIEEPGEPAVVTIRTRASDEDVAFAQERIRRLRDEVDVVFTSIHWGYGAGDELAEYVRPLGHALAEAGSDVVFGHHQHSVLPIEFHRDTPIVYSPGTFLGQQGVQIRGAAAEAIWASMSKDGYIARFEVGRGRPPAVGVVPITQDPEGHPLLARGGVFDRIAERLDRLCRPFGSVVERRGEELGISAATS